MAKAPVISTKRLAITKANAQVVIIVGVASFVTVFCLVATNAVISQNKYQARVTKAKEAAHKQLLANTKSATALVNSYDAFIATPNNIIGGNTNGTGDNDGNNAKIILDALPSTYDFPALTSTLEKILTSQGLKISGISGTDDEVKQQSNGASPDPKAVSIPFSFGVSSANYGSVQQLVSKLQQSIRPIQIDTLDMSGSANSMTLNITAHTYYQPAKSISITKEVIK